MMFRNEHEDRQDEGAGPGELVPFVVGAHRVLEDHDGHVGERPVEVGAPELVVERGEQERRGLAGDARDAEQDAR